MKITLFEQSAVTIEQGGSILALDFGSMSSAETVASATGAAAALVSHIHGDHFSLENLQSIKASVYTVEEVATKIGTQLAVTVIKPGDQWAIPQTPFTVTAGASDHGPNVGPVEQVSFVVEAGESRAYFLADMFNPTPPPPGSFSVILAPIGNRGYTFDPAMAAAYIKQIAHTGLVIPIHYQRFDNAAERAQQLVDLLAGHNQVKILQYGESVEI